MKKMSKIKPKFEGQIVSGKLIIPQSEKDKMALFIESQFDGAYYLEVGKVVNRRSQAQNDSLHLFCRLVAEALNDAGLTIEEVLKHFTMEIDWNEKLVKEMLWRVAQERMFGKKSTTELDKHEEITKVWEVINRFLAKLKVESVPFPSKNRELKSGEGKELEGIEELKNNN